MQPSRYAGDYHLYAYDHASAVLPEPVAQYRTWKRAVEASATYAAQFDTVAIMRVDQSGITGSTWILGGRKLQRDGFGWVC